MGSKPQRGMFWSNILDTVQTFLPYPSFSATARVLDYRRLGKQRVEAYQIIRTLSGLSSGWKHHPAVRMWLGYTDSLVEYYNTIVDEWVRRGYRNTMQKLSHSNCTPPPWLGNTDFHKSHQSNLIRKNRTHYSPLFPGVPDNLPYVWPTFTKS